MNPIKTLGVMALLALMAMAIVGASSAAAEETSLCPEDKSSCPEEKVVEHFHEATLEGKKAVIKNNVATVECDVLFLGNTAGNTESGALLINGTFTYTNCSKSCTVKEVGGPAQIETLHEGHEFATVAIDGELKVECSGVSCVYGEEELMGTHTGPLLSSETNGEVKIIEQTVKKISGLFCSETGVLTITTTPLSATYITDSDMECRVLRTASGLYNGYDTAHANRCNMHGSGGFFELFP